MAKKAGKPKVDAMKPDPETEKLIDTMFDEDKYRKEYEAKKRIEAEIDAKLKAEEAQAQKEAMKKLDIDLEAQKKRKPSPEEIVMKTHPQVHVRIKLDELVTENHIDTYIQFSWGGVSHYYLNGGDTHIPYGLADHLMNGCAEPIRQLVDKKGGREGEKETKIVGYRHRYSVTPLNPREFAEAEDKARAMGYIPIKEREVTNAKTQNI